MSWWQEAVIYQVYPRSFRDSNGDGVGDLPGILAGLDDLQELGVDALWLSPFYPSPMADFGYDVSDYCDVHPLFGTLEDFDALVEAAHARGMKILVDLVPNHTSDQHAWFQESRASRDSPRRNWYIWKDPGPGGKPPNNWQSMFGGPAWTFDEATGQYYLHSFLAEQPDLDHRNPEVREAIHDAMRFWLKRGVDGFRVDVIWIMIKHADFLDDPPNPRFRPGEDPPWDSHDRIHSQGQPEVHGVIREMRAALDEFPERVMIGEIYLPIPRLAEYFGDGDECHMPFNFHLLELEDWSAAGVARLVEEYEASLPEGAWPNYVLGNHDRPRVASRLGAERARLAQFLLLTLRGTPTLYYGDELGMEDVEVPPERQQDPAGLRSPGVDSVNRDRVRAPLAWTRGGANHGFCPEGATPWLPMGEDPAGVSLEAAREEPDSLRNLIRELLAQRKARGALRLGEYRRLEGLPEEVLGFERRLEGERVVVLANLSPEPCSVALEAGQLLLRSHTPSQGPIPLGDGEITLGPWEGALLG